MINPHISVHSFGAGVVINYEFNEFVREQREKRPFRQKLAFIVVFVPTCILFAWGLSHLIIGLKSISTSISLVQVVDKNVRIGMGIIALNEECKAVVYSLFESRSERSSHQGDLLRVFNTTDTVLNETAIWNNPQYALDRKFAYNSFSSLSTFIGERRNKIMAIETVDITSVLEEFKWYSEVVIDFYSQVQGVIRTHENLPIWPNFLDMDFAVTYHRLVTQRCLLGMMFLHEGQELSHTLSHWHDLLEPISNDDLLYSMAFYMAPSFRRFIRNVQKNANGTDINWNFINDAENALQSIEASKRAGTIAFVADEARSRKFYTEVSKILNETSAYALRSSDRVLQGLLKEEAMDYVRCAWSGVVIIISVVGGILNLYGIRAFIVHFETQVKSSALKHRDITLDLRMERRKTNSVLHSMLPRKIADELKFRKFVRPTFFDSVSMYFSDVQGFTALSSRSSAEEIVIMLTELYTAFDDILDSFRVWKLETIGDAYSIIAGSTNQDDFESATEHAVEIVNCSLKIRDHIKNYPIPHIPNEIVKIRIGVHTGSVVAGVAGVGMHRYCVVGDALYVVEQVEASGKHGRVHISEDTKNAIFHVQSTETLHENNSIEDIANMATHANSALFVCQENRERETYLHGKLVKTFWIDRRAVAYELPQRPSFLDDNVDENAKENVDQAKPRVQDSSPESAPDKMDLAPTSARLPGFSKAGDESALSKTLITDSLVPNGFLFPNVTILSPIYENESEEFITTIVIPNSNDNS